MVKTVSDILHMCIKRLITLRSAKSQFCSCHSGFTNQIMEHVCESSEMAVHLLSLLCCMGSVCNRDMQIVQQGKENFWCWKIFGNSMDMYKQSFVSTLCDIQKHKGKLCIGSRKKEGNDVVMSLTLFPVLCCIRPHSEERSLVARQVQPSEVHDSQFPVHRPGTQGE